LNYHAKCPFVFLQCKTQAYFHFKTKVFTSTICWVTEIRIKMSRRTFNHRMYETTSTTAAKLALCSEARKASYKRCIMWCDVMIILYKNMIILFTHKKSEIRRIKITPKQRLIRSYVWITLSFFTSLVSPPDDNNIYYTTALLPAKNS